MVSHIPKSKRTRCVGNCNPNMCVTCLDFGNPISFWIMNFARMFFWSAPNGLWKHVRIFFQSKQKSWGYAGNGRAGKKKAKKTVPIPKNKMFHPSLAVSLNNLGFFLKKATRTKRL